MNREGGILRKWTRVIVVLLGGAIGAMGSSVPAQSPPPGTTNGEWPSYHGDNRNHHYSPLAQINAGNFGKLEVAWRFKTDSLGTRPEYKLEGTPLMVGGVLYTTAGTRRAVVALDPVTGELLWAHGEHEGARAANAPRQLSGRGLAYWTDGTQERILYVTPGYRLIALDAKTGVPVPGFGQNGAVDLKREIDQDINLVAGEIGLQSAPVVAKDVVLIGAAFREGFTPKTHKNNKGYVHAFDVRTGKRLWTFHTVPKPGEFGYDTWLNGSAEFNGSANVWGGMAYDPELDYVYMPTSTASSDYLGVDRPGNNLFAESLVCVEAKTGTRVWHFQAVHHGLWDYDFPTHPVLGDITVDGRRIKAVMQVSKQGFAYAFDRKTGQPVWPIEERPVPQTTVPGEWTSPTQPFPTRPPAFDLQGAIEDNLMDFTPELRRQARDRLNQFEHGPLFTPPTARGVLAVPAAVGAANWGGAAFDPETGVLYVPSRTTAGVMRARTQTGRWWETPERSGGVQNPADRRPARSGAPPPQTPDGAAPSLSVLNIDGLPIFKPPYARVTAIDMNAGTKLWVSPLGNGPRNHPLLTGLNVGPLGDSLEGQSV